MFDGLSGLVTIEIEGDTHQGVYKVERGILSVISHYGEKFCHLNDVVVHPEVLAQHLLYEIVTEILGGGEDA